MAYNHGKAERKWKLWKEKEEKIFNLFVVGTQAGKLHSVALPEGY